MGTKVYIGIDPGITGAITLLDKNADLRQCIQFPTFKEAVKSGRKMTRLDANKLAELFNEISLKYEPQVIAIEKQIAMPGQNAIGTFNTGKGYGMLLALLAVYFPKVELDIITCKEWQDQMIPNRTPVESKIRRDKRRQLKKDSVTAAKENFPEMDFTKTKKSKVESDGKTDSALIALYCYNKHFK